MSKKEYKLKCAVCGCEFVSSSTGRKYCGDECKKEAGRQQDKIRHEKNNPYRNRSLVEMAVEAREHGMTYGQYVAYLESKKQKKKHSV